MFFSHDRGRPWLRNLRHWQAAAAHESSASESLSKLVGFHCGIAAQPSSTVTHVPRDCQWVTVVFGSDSDFELTESLARPGRADRVRRGRTSTTVASVGRAPCKFNG
jgi:hypothetical protein